MCRHCGNHNVLLLWWNQSSTPGSVFKKELAGFGLSAPLLSGVYDKSGVDFDIVVLVINSSLELRIASICFTEVGINFMLYGMVCSDLISEILRILTVDG